MNRVVHIVVKIYSFEKHFIQFLYMLFYCLICRPVVLTIKIIFPIFSWIIFSLSVNWWYIYVICGIQVHFVHRHSQDRIVTLEEVNQPHTLFPQCNIFYYNRYSIGCTRSQICVAAGPRGSDRGCLLWRQRNRWGRFSHHIGRRWRQYLISSNWDAFFVLQQQLVGSGAESATGAGKVGTNDEKFG